MQLRCFAAVLALAATAPAQSARIDNGLVQLDYHLDPALGLVLESLTETGGNASFTIDTAPLWELQLRDSATGTLQCIQPGDQIAFQVFPSATSFVALWIGVGRNTAGLTTGATVALRAEAPPGEPVVLLSTAAVLAPGDGHSLYSIKSPRIQVGGPGDPADQVLSVPQVGGLLVQDPLNYHPTTVHFGSHPGLYSMQWFSYYDRTAPAPMPNLFFGTRATGNDAGTLKTFILNPAGSSLSISVQQEPPDNHTALAWAVPYPFALGIVRGDWYDAARFYRSWAVQQPWTQNGPMRDNASYSRFAKDLEMFGTFAPDTCASGQPLSCAPRPDPINYRYMRRDVDDQKRYFGVQNVGVRNSYWDNNSAHSASGAWLPVRPAWESAAASLSATGVGIAPYFYCLTYSSLVNANPALPTLQPGYGEVFVQHTVLADNFNLCGTAVSPQRLVANGIQPDRGSKCGAPTLGCPVPQQFTLVCTANQFAVDYTKAYAGLLAGYGANGLYLDSLTHHPSRRCHDPSHSHGIADSAEYHRKTLDLVTQVKAHARGPSIGASDFYIASESQSELYVGEVELAHEHTTYSYLIPQSNTAVSLAPLFETVYGDYQRSVDGATGLNPAAMHLAVNTFTRNWWLGARQYYSGRLFFGGTPGWGSAAMREEGTLTLARSANADYAAFATMVRGYMGILRRATCRRTMIFGERRRDPATLGINRVDLTGLPWFYWIYDTASQPTVYAGAFYREDLQELGVLLLNWSDDADSPPLSGAQTFSYTVDPAAQGIPPGTYNVWRVMPGEDGDLLVGTFQIDQARTFQVTVPERSVRYFYFQRTQ